MLSVLIRIHFFTDDSGAIAGSGMPSLKRRYPFGTEEQTYAHIPTSFIQPSAEDIGQTRDLYVNENTCFGSVEVSFLIASLNAANSTIDNRRQGAIM